MIIQLSKPDIVGIILINLLLWLMIYMLGFVDGFLRGERKIINWTLKKIKTNLKDKNKLKKGYGRSY